MTYSLKQLIRFFITKAVINSISTPTSSQLPVQTPGLDYECCGNDVLVIADCIILQKCSPGPSPRESSCCACLTALFSVYPLCNLSALNGQREEAEMQLLAKTATCYVER